MKVNKSIGKFWRFFRPTKRKSILLALVLVILSTLVIFNILEGRPSAHCAGDTFYRVYYTYGKCVKPTLIDDIIGYTKVTLFEPGFLLLKITGGELIYIPFFILNIFIWYTIVCTYISLKRTKLKKVKNKKILLLLTIVLFSNTVSGISDSNPSNNVMNINVDIINNKKLELVFVPIDYKENYETTITKSMDFIKSTYPLSDDGLSYNQEGVYKTTPNQRADLDSLLADISRSSIISRNTERTIGVVPPNWFHDYTYQDPYTHGYSKFVTKFGISFYLSVLVESLGVNYANIAAHELGHSAV